MPKIKKKRIVTTRRITMPNPFRTAKRVQRINTSYKSPMIFEPEAYEGNQDLKTLLGSDDEALTKLLSGDKEYKKLFDLTIGTTTPGSAVSEADKISALKKYLMKGKSGDVTSESMQRMLFSGTDKFYKPALGTLGNETSSLSSMLGMPQGVSNLKLRDKQIKLQQQIQAANAGILDEKTRKLKALAKILKKKAQAGR